MKHPKHLILSAFVAAGLLFSQVPTALAQAPSQIIHASDAGKIINLNKGDIIQFSLDENIPNTSPWTKPIVVWTNVAGNLQEIGMNVIGDFTKDPIVFTTTTFNYYGVKPGQTILMFYKNGISSKKNPNGSNKIVLADAKHPMITELVFIVNVNESSKQETPNATPLVKP